MLTLGAGEIAVIFILALVLFGPKKLPELGRTIGKAMTEFNRARNDLKATFEREMRSLEQENLSIQKIAHDTVKELTDHATELADHASYNYGLPSAEEVYNPLDYEAHAAENASHEQAAIAAPVEEHAGSLEFPAEPIDTVASVETSPVETTVETASNSVIETSPVTSALPTIVPATEGTVSRANGKATIALQAARERALAEQAVNPAPEETTQHS
jgi:sec-independent protein translocase protein TatA